MIKIGIMGGIASGKSYVASIFNKKYGIPVYNSDDRAKVIMTQDRMVKFSVMKAFGRDSYIDGNINKNKFNALLFDDKSSLDRMNSIVIPAIRKDFDLFCKEQNAPYVLQESAILLETGGYLNLDKIICVVSDLATREERAIRRGGLDKELFLKKVAAQSSDEEKIAISDWVIYNNDKLEEQIDLIHNILIK